MFYKKNEEPGEVMDRNQLLNLLVEYYETYDLEEMKPKLKNDLKCAKKIQKLLDHTNFELDELLMHLQAIFSNLFNSVLIRKLRSEVRKL
jgi:hypothetical protein